MHKHTQSCTHIYICAHTHTHMHMHTLHMYTPTHTSSILTPPPGTPFLSQSYIQLLDCWLMRCANGHTQSNLRHLHTSLSWDWSRMKNKFRTWTHNSGVTTLPLIGSKVVGTCTNLYTSAQEPWWIHKPPIRMLVLPGLQGRQRALLLSLASLTPPLHEAIEKKRFSLVM